MGANALLKIDTESLQAAKFAHAYAQTHCHQNSDSKSCAWYHGSWQFLRLLDLVSTPDVHAAHFNTQLERIAGDPTFKNILVCGSADSGLVKTIHEALRHRQSEIKLTVVDICETPLKDCQLYSDKNGFQITTSKQDVLEGFSESAFDAIFTHSFMGYFDDATRQRLLHIWARSLRTGGRLITVQRIRENYANEVVQFKDHEIDAFIDRAENVAHLADSIDLSEFNIVEMAKKFAESFRNFPVRSAEQLKTMIETAGFTLERFERQTTQGTEGVTGPSVPNATGFYMIAAERI